MSRSWGAQWLQRSKRAKLACQQRQRQLPQRPRRQESGLWRNGVEQSLIVEGGKLGVVTSEGELALGPELVGALLEFGDGERVTIASYSEDSADTELAWYTLTYKGENICGEGTRGLFVPGLWNIETGASALPGATSLGKRRGLGHASGLYAHGAGRLLRQCRAHTQNGTTIDVVDFKGIQQQASAPGEMAFEAGWGPDGAVCVNQARYADSVVGQGPIAPSCWSKLPRCSNQAEAQAAGALLANFSDQGERHFCEAPPRY